MLIMICIDKNAKVAPNKYNSVLQKTNYCNHIKPSTKHTYSTVIQ